MGSSEPSFSHIGKKARHSYITIDDMWIQYGHCLTLLTFVVAATCSSSVEDVLAGMSNSQIQDILSNIASQDYPNYGGSSMDYPSLDYDSLVADETNVPKDLREDVAKPLPAVSQGQHQQGSSMPFHANPMLPAYCDPPNPCPIGYTSSDGCIEDFENTSEFSRRFQSGQECICDTEHMFNCPVEDSHRSPEDIAAVNFLADIPGLVTAPETRGGEDNNPYLDGLKLPVAAKKGHF